MGAISDFMSGDHDRLDAILAEFSAEKDAEKARAAFSQFDAGLRTHIDWEEEILFPRFEERTGMRDSGPTAVMRMEHEEIKQHLQRISETIGKSESDIAVSALLHVLSAHNHKEENILYPWLDQSLSEEEATDALSKIKG